ncbi:CotH kinase family protein [uncultured Ruminococcus sp.]|uniref:CotH kinase family protein n=1 Tax=uncultured Ruminococcus sp. TaxID=165186 RepID=UPI0025E6AA9B|nr:CotH kinase family protein [uncultured Ruminococcus sp.]
MKNFDNAKRLAALTAALVMCMTALCGCSEKTDSSSKSSKTAENSSAVSSEPEKEPIVTLPVGEKQVINETPVSYESFGMDKAEKEDFKNSVKEKTQIPVISITTNDEDIVSLEKYVSCVVDVFNTDGADIDEASAGIKVRGNSSAYYGDVNQILHNQVPYRIKFDKKTNMLGLNDGAECRSWVLLKSDWDLIRNDIAFRFGRRIMQGDDNFCSDAQLVHVYVNEEFKGIYLLCEQSQINSSRVDISEPEEGYTGNDIGYYLELDNYADREETNHYITMDYEQATVTDLEGTKRQFVPADYSIKNDLYTQNQIDFIDKYMNNLFKIVYEACENGKFYEFDENYDLKESSFTTAEETVSAVMDIQSVVDVYMLYEIVHDYDCGEGSFFMCVDFSKDSKCPKLKFTSPWDFNWAYNDSTEQYHAATFADQSFVDQNGDRSNPWFIILMKQDWFVNCVKEKWTALKADNALQGCIDEEVAYLEKYKNDLNKTDEWATESADKLLDWIRNRLYFLNGEWLIK